MNFFITHILQEGSIHSVIFGIILAYIITLFLFVSKFAYLDNFQFSKILTACNLVNFTIQPCC